MLVSSMKFLSAYNKKESRFSIYKIASTFTYVGIFCSLFYVDHVLGNGMIDAFARGFCRVFCFVKKKFVQEASKTPPIPDPPTHFGIFFAELVALIVTMVILQKYKMYRRSDRLDDLLKESKLVLRQTADFLERWRERRIPSNNPQSYLDEEPTDLKPLELEVPILHMAIVDTLGSTRTQHERGDGGDTINVTDSAILSVTSLLDEEDLLSEVTPELECAMNNRYDSRFMENYLPDSSTRQLWSVTEEE